MLKLIALWTNRLLWTVLVTALLLVASYVSLGRYAINYVEPYQDQLLKRFVEYSALSISVEKLYGRWSHLSPIFTLEQFALYDPADTGEAVLTIENINIQLDLLGSLLAGTIQIERLEIAGVECSLEEVEPGRWQLKAYPIAEQTEDSDFDHLVDLLLSVGGAELINTRLQLFYQQGDSALLQLQEISLQHEAEFRRVRLQASFDQSENPLMAIIESQGDPRDSEYFSASGYLKLDNIDFSQQLPALRSLGINLQDIQVDSEVWLNWRPGEKIAIQGRVSIPLFNIAVFSGTEVEPLKDFSFDFRVEKIAADNWHGWLPSVKAQWQQQAVSFEQVFLTLDADSAQFFMPSLSLDQTVSHLLALRLLNERGVKAIETLSPTGILNNFHLSLSRAKESGAVSTFPRFVLQANLNNVELSSWKGAPGVSGLNGYLQIVPDGGVVELDLGHFTLDFPDIYHHELAFDSGKGQIVWHMGKERLTVNSGPLTLEGGYGHARGLLSLDLPVNQHPGDPQMDLTIGLKNTDASYRNQLIPYILSEKFLDWVELSNPTGRVVDGGFIYRGSLRKNARDDRSVQLYLNVENASLDYHRNWPKLTAISGIVLIDDGVVDANISRAKMFQLDVEKLHIATQPLKDGGVWLAIDAEASGSANDALRIINESAVHEVVGSVFENWLLDGAGFATIKLGIPLAGSKAKPDIDVLVELAEATLSVPDYRLQLDKINGPIHYNSASGIHSSGIKAQLYNKPATVKLAQSAAGAITADISGRVSMRDVETWSRQPALTFFSGETDFNARVFIAEKQADIIDSESVDSEPVDRERVDKRSEFSVNSNLLGVSIDLPEPYRKTADMETTFHLTMPLTTEQPVLKMTLKEMAQLQLSLDQGVLQSGLVILGNSDNYQHHHGELVVTGQLDYFNIDQWWPVLDQYLEAANQSAVAGETSVVDEDTAAMNVSVRGLSLAKFEGFGRHFETTMVDAQKLSSAWKINVENSVLDGEFILSDDHSLPLIGTLERLSLPGDALQYGQSENNQKSEKDVVSADPVAWAELALDLSIAALSIGEDHYGNIQFKLRSDNSGLRLDDMEGTIRGVHFGGKVPAGLEWWRTEQGDQSRLYGDFSFGDVGDVLKAWQYEHVVESKAGAGGLDLSWSGRPDEWQLKKSQGSLYLKIEDGRFLKASEAAAGTLKVVGIVNFSNIIRRLQLDFSDLYKGGISYDKIEGELLFANGELIIGNKFTVKSPSSRFQLKGRADMELEQLDMEMITTLPVANNLPWVVALAAGLPVAAGVYVASKIFEDQVDRISSMVYTVRGDWNNPELKFDQIYDNTKKY